MMTRSDCRLQFAILSLALYVLLLPGYSKADFKVTASGLNDQNAINRVQFPNVFRILGVTSPYPNLILGDTNKTNTITYNSKLPSGCAIPVTITGLNSNGIKVQYTGIVTHTTIDPNALSNAVGVKGDKAKLDALKDELSKTHVVQVVSRRDAPPPQGNEEMAIVLVDKANSSNFVSRQDLKDKIDNEITKTPFAGITLVTGNCGLSCSGVCNSDLKLEAGFSGVTAIVKSDKDIVTAYLPTKWEGKCDIEILGVCTASPKHTCYNGGLCAANRDSSPNICTCTPQTNLYGPRCQLLTRSYEGTNADSYVTSHKLFKENQLQTLTFSFEHAGKCQLNSGLCSIIDVEASGKKLLKVEEGVVSHKFYDTATLPSDVPADEINKMTIYSDRMVQNNRWIDVSVQVASDGSKATTVFCTKEASPVCVEKTIAKAGVVPKMREADLTLGGNVRGCFRNLRFYGSLVDLKLSTSKTGTSEGCNQQDASCSTKCGDGDANSNCYGVLGSTLPCSCKCASSKRMPAERITLASQCSAQCTTDSPIISITGSGTLDWKGTSSAPIPLDPQAPLTISFQMRTKKEVANELLKVVGGGTIVSIKLEKRFLSACVPGECYSFSSVPVNDGNWHEIFAMVAKRQLTVRVGDYSRVHIIGSNLSISGATVSMQLSDGCVRDVRVSGVYMPTSGTDKTEEKDSSNSVKLESSGSVTAGSTCAAVK